MDPDTRFDALVEFMLTVAYVDGVLDPREKDFVTRYLDQLAGHVGAASGNDENQRKHFEATYQRLDEEIGALAAEVMSAGDDGFVKNRLKVRAVALFRDFPAADQTIALELVGSIVTADGTVSPHEQVLHDELVAYLQAPVPVTQAINAIATGELLEVTESGSNGLTELSHPLLDPLEKPYSTDPVERQKQVGADYQMIFETITAWERQRARGNGRLTGVNDISQVPLGTSFLDGHVYVMRPDRQTELIVIGDLHGCYACLKAAMLQSEFVDRVRAYQEDPANNPDVKLVLLGDYLDRGRYGFEGVIRGILKLFVTLPNHVILLRGNHEYLIRRHNNVVSAVNPAEAVPSITDLVSTDVLEAYRHLFEHMPTSLVFDRTLFVHGGIPRDDTTAERYRDLSSLDDAVIRFEMMWSDPVDTASVPLELQRESARFSFGRDQFRAFMERVGCHAMIRGHEQVDTGFRAAFEGGIGGRQLYTLFSAGGHDNDDLPAESRYRNVTPMALTIRRDEEFVCATPWPIEYHPFNDAANNGLYRK